MANDRTYGTPAWRMALGASLALLFGLPGAGAGGGDDGGLLGGILGGDASGNDDSGNDDGCDEGSGSPVGGDGESAAGPPQVRATDPFLARQWGLAAIGAPHIDLAKALER